MTSFEEKAQQAEGPDVYTTSQLPDRPAMVIWDDQLVGPDELTAEGQFPEFGEFAPMVDPPLLDDDEPAEWWEIPQQLAAVISEEAAELEQGPTGLLLDVDSVAKTPAGEWRFVVDVYESTDE